MQKTDSTCAQCPGFFSENPEGLKQSEEKFRLVFNTSPDATSLVDFWSGAFIDINAGFTRTFGYLPEDLVGRTVFDVGLWGSPQDRTQYLERLEREGFVENFEACFRARDGRLVTGLISAAAITIAGRKCILTINRDITERKQIEEKLRKSEHNFRAIAEERKKTIAILNQLHRADSLQAVARIVTHELRDWLGIDAAAIRLRDGDDYPYFQARGFAQDFVQAEKRLCTRDLNGHLIRDNMGRASLDCMCGTVIRGRFDPRQPFFTAAGSFWTNSTSAFSDGNMAKTGMSCLRKRCHAEGYESVALIPLRTQHETFGLMQFNHRAKDFFTPQRIAFLEQTAEQLALSIGKQKAEEGLRASEERFRQVQAISKIGYWAWHAGSNRLTWSDEVYRIFGQEPDHYTPSVEAFEAAVHPDDIDKYVMERDRVLASQGGALFDHRILRPDGQVRHVQELASLIRDENGEVVQVSGTIQDITSRKEAEEELRHNEKRLRILNQLHQMTDASFQEITDFALESAVSITQSEIGYLAFLNEAETILSMHSWSQKALELCTMAEKPLHYPVAETGLWGEAVRRRKPIITNDYVIPNSSKTGLPKGHVALTRHMNVPIFDGDRIVALAGVGNKQSNYSDLDVTQLCLLMQGMWGILQRKKDKDALKSSHERFLTVLDSIDATIYVADLQTREILFMNRHMIESFGRDLTGEKCWSALRGESAPCAICKAHSLLDASGEPAGVIVWQDLNPITGKWYLNHDRAIKWTDGRYVLLQIATDITQMKTMESALRQAQKMEAIGTLAGGIAHDFNNILFPLVGFAEMLQDDLPKGSPQQESVRQILQAASRAKELVQQILAFSRQADHEVKPVKLQPIVQEALKLLRASLPVTITIESDSDPLCRAVIADPTQIHQIIMNLATNAFHAMEPVGGKLGIYLAQVHVEAQKAPGMLAGEYARLTVTDTGTGIPKKIMEKIFEPYFTTKDKQKGTGLGLSVVMGIVKSSHGDIRVTSEPGQGTTFTVYLPVVERMPAKPATVGTEMLRGGTERILLVDDEEAIVRMEAEMLKRLGYAVTARVGSVEALEAFKACPDRFDLIITDMAMPNMTGIQLGCEIKKIRPKIPIIICTGFSDQINPENCTTLGIQGFVMKPVIRKELAAVIRGLLDSA
jgi:PAS domain S-box-containing protein